MILDKIMLVVIIFNKKVVKIVCTHATPCGSSVSEKEKFTISHYKIFCP